MTEILQTIVSALLPGIMAFGLLVGLLGGAGVALWIWERLGLV